MWITRKDEYSDRCTIITTEGFELLAICKDEKVAKLMAAAPDLLKALRDLVNAPDQESAYNAAQDAMAVIRRATELSS